MLPIPDEYMAACMTEARRTLDWYELMQEFNCLSKLPFSEQDLEKLGQSLEDGLKRLGAGERLPRRSEKDLKPTPEQIAAQKEFLTELRQKVQAAKELRKAIDEQRDILFQRPGSGSR